MNVIVHDTQKKDLHAYYPDDVIYAMRFLKDASFCTGCFGCWLKTPGKCVIKDDLQDCAIACGNATNIFILTKITYGGYSSYAKVFFDRSLGYAMPYFTNRQNEIHHKLRYSRPFRLWVIGYEAKSLFEVEVFQSLIRENSVNFESNASVFIAQDEQDALLKLHYLKEELHV